jgi:hypothetical protein
MAQTHKGPAPAIVAGIFTSLFLLSIIFSRILTHGAPIPIPYGDPWSSQQYFLSFPSVVRLSGFLQLGAAITLGILTASLTSRLQFLGVTASGAHIAFFGGMAASIFLAISGVSSWVLSQPGAANTFDTMRSIQLLGFAAGGAAHVATLGLLVAGIAVPSLMYRYLPRGWAMAGIVIGALSELSTFSMILPRVYFLLPAARFSAMVWLIIAGVRLPRSGS